MEPVNVLVVSSISEESLRQIAAVSPSIKVQDSSHLWDAPDMVTPEKKGDFSSDCNCSFDSNGCSYRIDYFSLV